MAKTAHSLIALFLVFNFLISITIAARDLRKVNINEPNPYGVTHPSVSYDRGYLIPGLGRGIIPKSKNGFNPFTYNPITGNDTGIPGFTVPNFGGIGNGRYLPGFDDTFIPNPGFEIPNPGHIGKTPVLARP